MNRRVPAMLLVVLAIVGVAAATRRDAAANQPLFSRSASGWMPSAPAATGLTQTWFCPGAPANGSDGVGGSVSISNAGNARVGGSVLLFNERGESQRVDLGVDPYSTTVLDLAATLAGDMVASVVEAEGGSVIVEQRSVSDTGDSIVPCATATSDIWYLADGFTVDGSLDQIVLTNPYEQTAVVNLEFATREGARRPASYRGLTVPARSVRVVDLGAPGAGAQSEPILAVSVEASRGRLVVGRSQQFLGGGRAGSQVTLASPAVRDQWWFVNGVRGDGTTERYSIYNPTDEDVDADVLLIGIPVNLPPVTITVPAHEVATFEPSTVAELPAGRFIAVFNTLAQQSVVVERATTVDGDGGTATSVIAGATPRQDGYVASTWYLGTGPDQPIEEGLVIFNADNSPGTVSVSAIGSSGPVVVPGMEAVDLAPASLLTLDLTDPMVLGRQVIVESTTRIFVERSVPNGRDVGRSSAWAVPAS